MSYDSNINRLPDPYHNNGVGFVSAGVKGSYTGTQHPLNSGGVVSVQYSSSYWEMDIAFPETIETEIRATMAFLEGLNGAFTPFYISIPQYRYPISGPWDTSSDTLIAKSSISLVTPRKIKITDWSTRGGDLNIGDMLKFTNMSKIYKVTDKYLEIATDTIFLTLSAEVKFPSLIAVAGLEPNDILFKVRLKNNTTPSPTLQPNGIYSGFNISVREDVTDE